MNRDSKITKMMTLSPFTIVLLALLIFTQVGSAQLLVQRQYGKLINVEATGNGPDNNGRYEYIVTMEIRGVITYLTMWLTPGEYQELKNVKGEWITIFYQWDGQGHRIYKEFKYGDHTGNAYYIIKDNMLYQIDPVTGYQECIPSYIE